MRLRRGKLPTELLEELIALRGASDSSVFLGPAIGEDAAVVDIGDRYLVLKTDPVTFTSEEIGWYAVHINANDVATTGAAPRWFQATVLLPVGSDLAIARAIFEQVHQACLELKVAVTGGHTEVTPAVNRPLVVGDMQGLVSKEGLVTTSGAGVGDSIILTKVAGIEGTAILARELGDALRDELGDTLVNKAAEFLRSPGISVVTEALLAAETGATSLHDPTEGGVAQGLWELSKASGKWMEVDAGSVPIAEETIAVCEIYELNPLSLIASGSLLVTLPSTEGRPEDLLTRYQARGVPAKVIGRVGEQGLGVREVGSGKYSLEPSEADELSKVLGD